MVRKIDKSPRAEPRPSLRYRESVIEGRPAPQVQNDPCPEGTWKKLSMPPGRLVGTGRGRDANTNTRAARWINAATHPTTAA